MAAWFTATTESFEKIGECDHAISWGHQATEFGRGHRSFTASRYWTELLQDHRLDAVLDAHVVLFRRWPNSSTSAKLHNLSGGNWAMYRDEVMVSTTRENWAVIGGLYSSGDRSPWDRRV